jgi:hypothetical protein
VVASDDVRHTIQGCDETGLAGKRKEKGAAAPSEEASGTILPVQLDCPAIYHEKERNRMETLNTMGQSRTNWPIVQLSTGFDIPVVQRLGLVSGYRMLFE